MQEWPRYLQVHDQEGSLVPDACQDFSGSTRFFQKPQRSANKNQCIKNTQFTSLSSYTKHEFYVLEYCYTIKNIVAQTKSKSFLKVFTSIDLLGNSFSSGQCS